MKKLSKMLAAILATLMLAVPVCASNTAESEVSETPAPCRVQYYKDADRTEVYDSIADVPADSYVYYEIKCDDGYFCKRMKITADYADSEKILFGSNTPAEPELFYALLGDVDGSGKVNLSDASDLLHFIAGHYYRNFPDTFASDLNGDGNMNITDVSLILKLIAKWDVDICEGVSENFELYCNLGIQRTTRFTVMEDEPMFHEVSVIKSTDGLMKYIDDHAEKYLMNDPDASFKYSDKRLKIISVFWIDTYRDYYSDELKELYDEDFFEENELVIYDHCDSYYGNLRIERVGDTLELVIPVPMGVAPSVSPFYHCMIPVKKSLGINLDSGVSIVRRREDPLVTKNLYNYEVYPVPEDRITVNYYN